MPLPLLLIVTGLMWFLAAVVIVYAWRAQRAATTPQTWTKQLATIVVSEVREADVTSGVSVGNSPLLARFVAHVEYTYTVGDVEFRGSTIDRGPRRGTTWRGRSAQRAAKFPIGKIVDVYVNRTNPDECALVASGTDATLSLWVIAGIMVALGIVVPLVAR